MKFYGMLLSMVDYPGKIGLTVFTKGCNFRCPICHNPSLVIPSADIEDRVISEDDIVAAIEDKWVDGLCVTGGEPTLHLSLPDTIARIKERTGVAVKLDTNGTNPTMIEALLDRGLVDFVAMDVKAPLLKGPLDKAIGFGWDDGSLRPSLRATLLLAISFVKKAPDYHFRTVCLEKFLSPESVGEIAESISPCRGYVLLPFDPHDTLDSAMRSEPKPSYKYMDQCLEEAKRHVANARIEGR